MLKQTNFILKATTIAFMFLFGISSASAWTAPTATPPGGNIATPINVGATTQTKVNGDICTTVSGVTKCLQTVGGAGGSGSLPSATAAGQTVRWNGTTWENTAAGDITVNGITFGKGAGNVVSNTATGLYSLFNNLATSVYNTAAGAYSLLNNTGSYNTAAGYGALYSNTTGSRNTANGMYALYSNTTGSQNTGLGNGADVATGALSNATAIGYNASVAASNTIQLGNTSVTDIKTSGKISTTAGGYFGGNVGIGTNTSPWAGNIRSIDLLGAGSIVSDDTYRTLQITNNAYSTDTGVTSIAKISGIGASQYYQNSGNHVFRYSSSSTAGSPVTFTEAMRITNAGNVGIGITAPAQKLSVAGVIESTIGGIKFPDGTTQTTASGAGSNLPSATQAGQTIRWNGTAWENTAAGDITVNGITVGKGGGNATLNTALGYQSLLANTTGAFNTATGANALRYNTTAQANTAYGAYALASTTTGYYNNATGYQSLYYNTSGYQNTADGIFALTTNTTGYNNTALGAYANVATGALTNATAIGYGANVATANTIQLGNALVTTVNTSGQIVAPNIKLTTGAGLNKVLTSDASGNATWANSSTGMPTATATGQTVRWNGTAWENTAAGDILVNNITVGAGSGTGARNTAMGQQALLGNTTGADNTAYGVNALNVNTSGTANAAHGAFSLALNTTGSSNTALGYASLYSNTIGNQNTAIGNWANVATGALSNATAIGYGASATASNQVVLGNDLVTTTLLKGNVGVGTAIPGATLDVNGPVIGSAPNFISNGDIMVGRATGASIFFDNNYNYSTGNYIRATDANTQGFFTSGAQRMAIASGGNVGIGTTAPAANLDIVGTNPSQMVRDTSGILRFVTSGGVNYVQSGSALTADSRADLRLSSMFGASNFLTIQGSSGNVGIGTTAPASKLDVLSAVSGTPITNGIARIVGTGSNPATGSGAGLLFAQQASDASYANYFSITGRRNNNAVNNQVDTDFNTGSPLDGTAMATRMTILGTGNVGIGTTAPAQKLSVAGVIESTVGGVKFPDGTTQTSAASAGNTLPAATATGQTIRWNGTAWENSAAGDILVNGITVGKGAGNVITNTAVGISALPSNTTGVYDTALGINALMSNTIGSYNTASGVNALLFTTGSENTASGVNALVSNTTGSQNTAYGNGALQSNTTGTYNTAIGYLAGPTTGALTNTTSLGNGAQATASNQVVIGNTAVTSTLLNGNVGIGITNPSYKLHTVTNGTGALALQSTNSSVGAPIVDIYDSGRFSESVISSTDGATVGTYIASYSNHPLMFATNHATAQMVLNTAGNVGIGTTAPVNKLTVVGDIGATDDICTAKGGGLCLSSLNPTGTAFTSTAVQAAAGYNTYTVAHGLGAVPSDVRVYLVCKAGQTDAGYSAGDYVDASSISYYVPGNVSKLSVWMNLTNVGIAYNGSNLVVANMSNGQLAFLDPTKWTFTIKARK